MLWKRKSRYRYPLHVLPIFANSKNQTRTFNDYDDAPTTGAAIKSAAAYIRHHYDVVNIAGLSSRRLLPSVVSNEEESAVVSNEDESAAAAPAAPAAADDDAMNETSRRSCL